MPKAEPPEPNLSADAFASRCKTLAVRFGNAVGLARGEVAFAPEIRNTEATMALTGRVSETVARNRGKPHQVVPIASISAETCVWAGYREAWQRQTSQQNFRFVEAGFTLHVGPVGELIKPQILRKEWVGRRSRAFVDLAGHPHWQLDVLESARAEAAEPPLRCGGLTESPEVKEFSSSMPAPTGRALLMGLTVEDMHLASSVMWWNLPGPNVAHTPASVAELDRWLLSSVAYLRQEAGRCRLVAS